ncbi:sperm-associated antigen 17 isoform X3 [Betta splendens]|uniref:Sperm-associated antigen 17 isoform X3 n=1 Tax=Betta splendens TaxID=158456 RepID=A0A6P7P8M3_BETSP|nr:sperm-associated antigen 17 isoform X3 [Betta splendens]
MAPKAAQKDRGSAQKEKGSNQKDRGSAQKEKGSNQKDRGSAQKSSAAAGAAANKNWEAGLVRAQLEEDSWPACVCFVLGSSPADEELVQVLASLFQRHRYRRFTMLNWDNTLAKIHELGNPKAKKPDNTPLFYEVTESAKVLLDAGQDIPCELMAKILKFQLLQIKAVDQQRQEAEKINTGDCLDYSNEKKTKLKRRDDVDTPKFRDEEPDIGPTHLVLVLGFYQPQLIVALDAIGVHVADVIKLCSERRQTPELHQEQHASGDSEQSLEASPVLDSDSARQEQAAQARRLHLFWSGLRPVLDSAPMNSKLHDVALLSYTVPVVLPCSHTQDPKAVLELGNQILEGVAHMISDCLVWRRQHQHYLDNLRLISVPALVKLDSQLLEAVPVSLPRVSMTVSARVKSVQEENPPQEAKLHPVGTEVDMRYYSNLLDLVSPEACSVPLLLGCMLEQVEMSTEQPVTEKPKPYDGPWLDPGVVSYMLQSFQPLVATEEERRSVLGGFLPLVKSQDDKKRLAQMFEANPAQKTPEHPVIVRHHDERALRLKDVSAVEGFDPAEVELSVMMLSPAWRLIESLAHEENRNSCWMAIKQQLQHYCTVDMVSWADVERLLHQSVLESMTLTSLDQNGVLLRSAGPLGALEPALQQTIIPWDNPPDYAQQQLHNLRTKGLTFLSEDPINTKNFSQRVGSCVDLSDIQSCRLRSLFDWHYSEWHSATVFPQVLQRASEQYCCLDTFRGSHRNVFYIFCHNPMSPHRQCKEFWDVSLHTDVKFRKYLEHVADAISDWTKEEELKREERRTVWSPTDEKTSEASKEMDTLETVIRENSLKAWKLEQECLKMEEQTKKVKKESAPKGKPPSEVDRSDNKRSKTLSPEKKSRSEMAGSADKSISTPAPPVEETKEPHQNEEAFKHFTGYRMDGKLIHVSGRLQHLFPSDGGHISVENISFVEGSSLVKLAVRKDGHHFYTHINQCIVDSVTPPTQRETSDIQKDCKESVEMKMVKQGSLSAVLNNGIHLSFSFYGPTGECIVNAQEAGGAIPESSTAVPVTPTQTADSQVQPSEFQVSHMQEKNTKESINFAVCDKQTTSLSKPFTSLNLSLPTGLLLQVLREDPEGQYLHQRHRFTQTGVSSEELGMLVRQSFPLCATGAVTPPQDPSLYKELSRLVTSQGAVIRTMRDGSTEVLFADGSVSFSQDCGPVWVPDSEVEETSQEAEDNKKEQSSSTDAQRGCWTTTTPSGARICTVGTTHKHIPISPLLAYKATDPITNEVMLSREDLVVSVQNPDGSLIVEHTDGTRITSMIQNSPHILLHTGDRAESVTLKSTSECVCGCAECVCVTRCADSINEKMHIQSSCDTGEHRDSTETAHDKDSVGQACAKSESELICDEGAQSSASNGDKGVSIVKRNECEDEEESESTKERVFVVEKEGYATVVMYPERHTAHVFLADGTAVTGNNQGEYQVFPSNTGLLHVRSDGKCVYTSDSLTTPSPKSGTPTTLPGSYTFSHSDSVICDITDHDGNHFQVTEDGQVSVLNFSPASSSIKLDEEELEEEEREMAGTPVKHREHCPRLFVLHEDGSATELLSSQAVEELLYQACCDPAIAVLKEPLPDTQDEFGITILKPSHQSVWSKWLLGKQNPDITPPNLRNRGWNDFPRGETKTLGSPFGTNMGRGLTLSERFGCTTAPCPSVRSCPKVLEMRELYQHRPLTTPLKNTIDTRLKEYIEGLMEREQRSEEIKVKDPRTEEETARASEMLSLVLSFAEEEDKGPTFDKMSPEDLASLYSKGVRAEQSDVSEDTVTSASDSFTKREESKWAGNLSQYSRQELLEEKVCREALRKKNIVPYFHAENATMFQDLLQQQVPDMKALSMNLPPTPKSDSVELFLIDAPQDTARPLNATPSKSASSAAALHRPPEKRLSNPTPQATGERHLRSSSVPFKSVQVDVTGKPRKTKVRLPASILSSKPHSEPNQQFLSLEEPVRRKCRAVSLMDAGVVVRGFVLLPPSVDFGMLQEGTSSDMTVLMKNVGVDTCRFHVKQPPSATGLRVIYNPGPVAAGLHVELKVQLFAICGVEAGVVEPKTRISQDVTIRTETDILYLPVTATVLSESLYELWVKDHTRARRGCRLKKRATHT